MRRGTRSEAGFSLIEVLVTVAIVGITFVVFVGGMGTSIITSDYHRKQATVQASLRNVAEALKGTTGGAAYVECASPSSYAGALMPRRTAAAAPGSGTEHPAPSVTPAQPNSYLLTFFALGDATSFTPPAGMGEQWDLTSVGPTPSNRVTVSLADQSLATAAPIGTRIARSATAGSSIAHSVLLESSLRIERRGVTTAASAGASALEISRPAGTTFGDAMIAHIALRGSGTVVPPDGWALVGTLDSAGVKSQLYQRTSSGATTSFTWTLNPSAEAVGGIVSYGGVNAYVASIGNEIRHWSEADADFDHDPCPVTQDGGLQLLPLTVTAVGNRESQHVDVVKRRP